MVAAIRHPLVLCLIAILACAAMAAAPMAPMRPVGAPTPAATPSAVNPGLPAGASQAPAPTPPAGSGQPDTSAPGSANPNPKSPSPDAWTVCPAPGKFITCLLATDTALWVGTEDASLWRLDLAADPTQPSSWRQFTTAETHTDNIYGLAEDVAGRLWVGTQNQGVSVYNGQSWRNYGVIDGPIGEHVFAIAADADPARGSVWIATDHGLSSWTPAPEGGVGPANPPAVPGASTTVAAAGSSAVVAGNPKSKIENLKSPADTLPSSPAASTPTLAPGTWRHFTKADGLPSSQIYAVTVDAKGRVFAGTECDGLAWSDPPYNKWQSVRAEYERSGDGAGGRPMTAMSAGGAAGLPSNLSNCLLALPDGSVAYSTCYGVGLSRDGGRTWTGWQGISAQPYENYARGLASDKAGGLWIGTEHKGLVRLDTRTGAKKTFTKPAIPDDYVFSVAVTKDGRVWAGTYGEGLARLSVAALAEVVPESTSVNTSAAAGRGAIPASMAGPTPAAKSSGAAPGGSRADALKALGAALSGGSTSDSFPSTATATPTVGPVPTAASKATPSGSNPKTEIRNPKSSLLLPAPAAPPTLDELNAMLAALSKVPFVDVGKQPAAVRVDDDWLTQGDWLGRYGRHTWTESAVHAPEDAKGGSKGPLQYCRYLGGNHRPEDVLRHWIHRLFSDDVRSLEFGETDLRMEISAGRTTAATPRRQAEWDDHGETYPLSFDGPHIMCDVRIPAGAYKMGLYFFNKDGHWGANEFRDFTIRVKGRASPSPWGQYAATKAQQAAFDAAPLLAQGRVRDFWGGAYKQFVVTGPAWYTFEVNRNHSFCTILSGVFTDWLDEQTETQAGSFYANRVWDQRCQRVEDLKKTLVAESQQKGRAAATRFLPGDSAAAVADSLADLMTQEMSLCNAVWYETEGRKVYAALARHYWARAAGSSDKEALRRLASCYFGLEQFERWETARRSADKSTPRQSLLALREKPIKGLELGRIPTTPAMVK
jgi:hypothetical protein